MSINIVKNTSTVNTTVKSNRAIKYIVLHYTAGTSSLVGAAHGIANYFKGGNAGGSADYIVDDGVIVQYNPDIKNRYCWSVGGNKYTSMTTSVGGTYYNKCTNTNSISIEMCSNKTNKSTLGATDTDWYLTEATVNNAVELTKYLMQQYNIGIDNVIMHHHVTGKVCPNPWCVNSSRLTGWQNFLNSLVNEEVKEDNEVVTETYITVNGKDIKINRILKDNKNYIDLRGLENAGFEVGFNSNTKVPTLHNEVKELDIDVDGKNTSVEAVNIDGSNYVPIRGLANAVGNFEVDYDGTVKIKTK